MAPVAAAELTTLEKVLLDVLLSMEDVKLNTTKLAPILGIKDGKNVPRKINALINTHGFTFKAGKFERANAGVPAATPTKTASVPVAGTGAEPHDPAASDDDGEEIPKKKVKVEKKTKAKSKAKVEPKVEKDSKVEEDSSA